MFRHLTILFCFVLIFASCEDNKSSKETTGTASEEIPQTSETTSQEEQEIEETPEEEQEKPEGPLIVQEEFLPFMTKYGKENPEDEIRIKTRFGNIEVQLFQDTPLHRANFIFLVKNGYFKDTYFHRVAEGFVIQGGNSDNASTNKKRHYIGDYLIPSEFEAGHPHSRGAFSAAKFSEQNVAKASSPYEFFIVQSESGAHHLDNDHTVFGRVTYGMAVVDTINKVRVDSGEWPLNNIYMDIEIID